MLIGDFCLKVYLWPYLSYLANLKGLCSSYYYKPTLFFPIITLPPGVTLGTTIATFQPTPPTPTTVPTAPTTPTTQTTRTSIITNIPTSPTIPTVTYPTPTTVTTTSTTTAAPCPVFPVICLAGGIRPNPNCPCIDPRNNNVLVRQTGITSGTGPIIGSDTMVFSSLNNRRRRRRSVFKN